MKRSREETIIVNALVDAGLIQENKTDRTRCVVKSAIKEIRRERYSERHRTERGVMRNAECRQDHRRNLQLGAKGTR